MRRGAWKLAALLFGLALLPAFGAKVAVADTVKIAHSTWVGYGPLYIARDKGFFKKNGVDVDLVVMEDPKERFPTLMADRIQMIASTVDTALCTSRSRPTSNMSWRSMIRTAATASLRRRTSPAWRT